MTRKDYVLLAKHLNRARISLSPTFSEETRIHQHTVEEEIANALQIDNCRFNREKFLAACRVTRKD